MIAPIIGIFSELGQLFKCVSGTFDITDLLLILIASALSFLQVFNNQNIDSI
ncbi:hypothetical protein D3C87_1815890 [compost metagenome]